MEEVNAEERSEEQSDKEHLEKESMREDEVVRRQFLPRGYKAKHKFLSDVSVQRVRDDGPCDPNKKKKPRNAR